MKDSESEDGGHKRLRSSEMASRVITVASTRASAPATTVCRRVVRGGAATGGGATKSSATIRGRRSVRAAAEEPGAAAAAVRYDDIIAVLREAPIDGLDAAVPAARSIARCFGQDLDSVRARGRCAGVSRLSVTACVLSTVLERE